MGYYINRVSDRGGVRWLNPTRKAAQLLNEVPGAIEVTGDEFLPNLVCVVENGAFDAAGYCFDEAEWKAFREREPGDTRRRRWIVVPGAAVLSGYAADMRERERKR